MTKLLDAIAPSGVDERATLLAYLTPTSVSAAFVTGEGEVHVLVDADGRAIVDWPLWIYVPSDALAARYRTAFVGPRASRAASLLPRATDSDARAATPSNAPELAYVFETLRSAALTRFPERADRLHIVHSLAPPSFDSRAIAEAASKAPFDAVYSDSKSTSFPAQIKRRTKSTTLPDLLFIERDAACVMKGPEARSVETWTGLGIDDICAFIAKQVGIDKPHAYAELTIPASPRTLVSRFGTQGNGAFFTLSGVAALVDEWATSQLLPAIHECRANPAIVAIDCVDTTFLASAIRSVLRRRLGNNVRVLDLFEQLGVLATTWRWVNPLTPSMPDGLATRTQRERDLSTSLLLARSSSSEKNQDADATIRSAIDHVRSS
jgi:hypothetical protein